MASLLKFIFSVCGTVIMSVMAFPWSPPARAAEPASSNGKVLLAKYLEIKWKFEKNQFGLPLYLESEAKGDSLMGDVYGIVNYPFNSFGDALQLPAEWCNITTLHLNIKACTYRKVDNQYQLMLYSGSKHYQPPGDAHKLKFDFHVVTKTPEYLDISLTADKGPFFTRDYRIGLEAVALDTAWTFVHFSYSYRYGMLVRILIKTYFATAGHDKIGFSIVATDKNLNPVYVTGVRGALERNAVRYYLALLAYMDAMKFPANQQFDKRINDWFNLTEKYPRQLYEIDKEEYLASKRKEHQNQIKLQEDSEE
jgi:hypothetical protein